MAEQDATRYPIPPEIEGVLSLVQSQAIHRAATRVPPHLWTLPLSELEARLKPSAAAIAVRGAFWDAIGHSLADGKDLKVSRIAEAAGLPYDRTHDLLTGDPAMVVWLLQPIQNPYVTSDFLLISVMERVSEIVRLPIKDSRGRTIVKNARLILRAVEALDPFPKK